MSKINRGESRWMWMAAATAVLFGAVPAVSQARDSYRSELSLLPPVKPACVSSPFGPRLLPNRPLAGTFHGGIDLPAAAGTPVSAVAPGRLIRIQRHGVGGLEMLVQHDGFIGVYSHLGLVAPVLAEGAKTIVGGERIATVGRSGLIYGPHLYFGMIVDGRPVDPTPYLKISRCGAGTAAARDLSPKQTPPDVRLRDYLATGDR